MQLHLKLQGVILAFKHKRRMHLMKILAFKHNKAQTLPRVRFRKPQYVFPLLALTTLIVSPASATDSHDGIPATNPDLATFDTDSLDFGIDNRCSACISNVKEHFVGDLIQSNKVIKGYGGTRVQNVWTGTMQINIADDNGRVETFKIPHSYYAPDGDARLLSPQHWAKAMKKSQRPPAGVAPEQTFHNRIVLNWNQSQKTIPLDTLNVATFHLAPGYKRFDLYCQEAKIDPDIEDTEPTILAHSAALIEDEPEDEQVEPEFRVNHPLKTSFDLDGPPQTHSSLPIVIEDEEDKQLTNVSAEFLRYHHKFNHCSPKRMQLLARSGVIPRRLSKCPIPVCSSCLYGKATRRPWRSKPSDAPSDGKVPTTPGEVVSVDQLIANIPGLIAQMKGQPTYERYQAVTVFVDQATGFSFVHLQKGTTAEETVEGKELFERTAASMGHKIQHYHADNGIFASKVWRAHCISKHQGLSFAGVGAHHQNGVAENKIRLLQSQARTMLIHSAKRWPAAVTANLWPYAIRMANQSSLEMPSLQFKDGRTPLQAFAGSRATTNPKFWQPFACPIYVLDDNLQTAGGIHGKWKDRSRVGLYLGRSPTHARSIALVLNLQTGLVSPQFHVTFDPFFQTVKKTFDGLPISITWLEKTGFKSPSTKRTRSRIQREASSDGQPSPAIAPPQVLFSSPTYQDDGEPPLPLEGDTSDVLPPEPSEPLDLLPTGASVSPPPESAAEPLRRSTRITRPIERLTYSAAVICTATASSLHKWEVPNEIFCMSSLCPDACIPQMSPEELMAYGATNDPDTLYYHEAMAAPDRDKFLESMAVELNGQLQHGIVEPTLRTNVPPTVTVLPSVWAMRRKRRQTTGEVYKWKSRLNIGGHKQVAGIDYDLTYSPTVSWPAVRLALAMVLLHNWKARQVDYVMAYPQAPAPRAMYMEIPKGCEIPGHNSKDWVLHVKRNIYGGKDAGRVWYQYLRSKLESIDFVVSDHDDCVFYKGNAMYVLYTDDSILVGPDDNELDSILEEIRGTGLNITSEIGIDDFLGVNINHKPDGTIHMTQPKLIKSILEDLGLYGPNVHTKSTPMASTKLLSRHPDSPPFDQNFDYRRVIGKLLFLEKSTRPDLAYAVHQCARFSHNPREEHGHAVKWLGRYLKATQDKGITFRPTDSFLELHVDADFAGNWDKTIAADDPNTAQSRHGYILRYCGIPILWASQLQSIIALSTTEAEYIGMSRAVQDALPVIWLLEELKKRGHTIHATNARVHCRVFEDNSGAIEIANNPKYRPRTKHINQRYHFFRSHIGKHLSVHPIKTEEQVADLFTKPLADRLFTKHRHVLLGW